MHRPGHKYGLDAFLEQDMSKFDTDFGMTTDTTSYSMPSQPTITPVQSIGGTNQPMGNGIDPRGNAQAQAVTNLTTPPPDPTSAINMSEMYPDAPRPTVTGGIQNTEQAYNMTVSPTEQAYQASLENPKMALSRLDKEYFAANPEMASADAVASAGADASVKAGGKISAGTIAQGLSIGRDLIGGIQEIGQRRQNVKSLDKTISSLTSMLGSLTEKRASGIEAMDDQYQEGVRRMDARSSLSLGQRLGKARNRRGNIISGSQDRMIGKEIDRATTVRDINVANLTDKVEAQKSVFREQLASQREKANAQLEAAMAQKKKEELAAGPLGVANVIADVGIGVLTLGNPILGTALKMGKDALTDPYLS